MTASSGAASPAVSDESPDALLLTAQHRILSAAIDCILERGFYRASSNEIARRAGMTWGAIQYHFGTREKLMLAALEVFNAQFVSMLDAARQAGPVGGGTAERIERVAGLLAVQYGRPEYLASLQIILNLAHNPQTSAETAAAMERFEQTLSAKLTRLIADAIGPGADRTTISLVFHAFRGLAASHLIDAETSPHRIAAAERDDRLRDDAHRLSIALASLVDHGG